MTQAKTEATKEEIKLNEDYVDSVSTQYFCEPVKTECGHVFEKDTLKKWEDEKKKEAEKNEEDPNTAGTCPVCRAPLKYKDDEEMKRKTDEFLFKNVHHLPYRYVSNNLLKQFIDLYNQKKHPEYIQLVIDNPHIVFYAQKSMGVMKHIMVAPFDEFKKCLEAFKKIEGFGRLALTETKTSPIKLSYGSLSYLSVLGDIDKFNYCLNYLDNDLSLFRAYPLHLQNAIATKKPDFCKYILDVFKDDTHHQLAACRADGKNTLMAACSESTAEIVELLLSLCNEKELLSNNFHPDIFRCAAINPNISEGFAITQKLETFINNKFPNEGKKFIKYLGKRQQAADNEKLQKQMVALYGELKTVKNEINALKKQRTEGFPHFILQSLAHSHHHHVASDTPTSSEQPSAPRPENEETAPNSTQPSPTNTGGTPPTHPNNHTHTSSPAFFSIPGGSRNEDPEDGYQPIQCAQQ